MLPFSPSLDITGALLDGLDVLVRPVVLLLDEVVKEAGPRLGVVVGAEVAVADGLDQVEEHVPRVAGNAVRGGLRRLRALQSRRMVAQTISFCQVITYHGNQYKLVITNHYQ